MANIKNAAMGINSLEDLENNNTVIHALHPGIKIVTTFIYLVMVISFNRYAFGRLIPYIFYAVILIALANCLMDYWPKDFDRFTVFIFSGCIQYIL